MERENSASCWNTKPTRARNAPAPVAAPEPALSEVAGDAALALEIEGRGLSAAQRLQIHRNNCRISLTEALKANYPVINRLVGEAFFEAMAAAFISACPPREPRLSAYGAAFDRALDMGVTVVAWKCAIGREGIEVAEPVPIVD